MDLTIDILFYELSHKYLLKQKGHFHRKRILHRVVLWDGIGGQKDTLYLYVPNAFTPKQKPGQSKNEVLTIVAGMDFPEQPEDGAYLLCTDGNVWKTVNDVIDLVSGFYQWTDQLQSAELSGDGLQQYVTVMGKMIHADLCIGDRNFTKLAVYNAYEDSWHKDLFCGLGKIDVERIQHLNQSYPDMEKDFDAKGLIRNPAYSDRDEQQIYFFNIHFQGELHSRILINIKYEENVPALHALLTYAGDLLETKYVEFYQSHLADRYQDALYTSLRSLLLGEQVDKTVLGDSLRMISWLPGHNYRIIHLKPIGQNSEFHLNYYAAAFEQTFQDCRAVPMAGELYCFQNDSLGMKTKDNSTVFPEFLRENLFFSGVSNLFSDINNTYIHRKQADEALLYGMQNDPSIWNHEFRDISLNHILQKCVEEYEPIEICHPAIRTLLEYDQQHPGAELTETLKQYLYHRFHATETAQTLHVHRTTFLYRLGRIEELTGLRLQEPGVVLHLMLSFAIL